LTEPFDGAPQETGATDADTSDGGRVNDGGDASTDASTDAT
jgi:hypothetical protein